MEKELKWQRTDEQREDFENLITETSQLQPKPEEYNNKGCNHTGSSGHTGTVTKGHNIEINHLSREQYSNVMENKNSDFQGLRQFRFLLYGKDVTIESYHQAVPVH